MTMRLGEVDEAVEEIATKLTAPEDGDTEFDKTEKRLIGLGIRAVGSVLLHGLSSLNRIAQATERIAAAQTGAPTPSSDDEEART